MIDAATIARLFKIPMEQARVIKLFQDGKSRQQIARELGMNPDTVDKTIRDVALSSTLRTRGKYL
jgi:DNA-binding NarL/FixJ family response regulator